MSRPKSSVLKVIKGTVAEFMEDKALRLAAALAYYAIFSIGPLLVLAVGVAGLVMGEENVRKEVHELLKGLVGDKSAAAAESMMQSKDGGGSMMATVVGGAALLFGASGVFGQLQDALNTIWEVKPKPGQGIWGFIRQRFLSMTMVLGVGFLLLISMVLTTVVNSFSNYLGGLISFSGPLLQIINFVVAFGVITLLFAAIFKVLPDVQIRWRDVWVGAIGTALLFTLGKFLLGLYLGRESTSNAYGAGSAFVVIIMYIYYASLILFFGAEFTQVWVKQSGAVIRPSEHAVKLTDEERAEQGVPKERQVEAAAQGGPATTPATGGRRRSPDGPGKLQPVGSGRGLERGGEPPVRQPLTAAYAVNKDSMLDKSYKYTQRPGVGKPPLEQIQRRPWSFLTMALGAGLAAGIFFKFKTARKLFKWYVLARKLI